MSETPHDRQLTWIVRFNVRTRRLEPYRIGVRDIFTVEDEQLAHDPELSYLLDPDDSLRMLARTHFVHPDTAEVVPRTPEALAAGLYLEEGESNG